MKKKLSIILFVFLISISVIPVISYAVTASPTSTPVVLDYSGLVKCDGVVATDGSEPNRKVTCNYANLINMVNTTINWVFALSVPVVVGLLAYAGFLYMTGVEAKITQARKMMLNAVVGFAIALCAWFMVSTALKWLVNPNFQGADSIIGKTK